MLKINPFSIPNVITALIVFCVSVYVLAKNPRSKTHQAFLYFCITLFIWTFCYGVAYSCLDPVDAFWWVRFSFIGVAFIPSTNFYFYGTMLGLKKQKPISMIFFAISAVFLALNLTTDLVYQRVELYFWGYYTRVGPLHALFLVYWGAVWTYGLKIVYDEMERKKNAGDFIGYNQTKYTFFGFLGELLGVVDFFPKYGIPIYPFGYIVALYWSTIVAFAITRYRMLADISFLSRRVLIGSGILAVMGSILGLTMVGISVLNDYMKINATLVLMVVSVIIGTAIQPIFSRIKRIIDRTFFPEYFERKEKLARLGQEISLSKNSSEFNRIILESIFSSFKIIKSCFYTWNDTDKVFLLQSSSGWGLQTDRHSTTKILADHPIPKYLETKEYLLLDDVRRDFSAYIDQKALSLAMLELDGSLCIPIRSVHGLLGFFVLGDKESGLPYGKEDISTLKILADHTTIALENIDLTRRWNQEVTHSSQMDKILHTYMSSSVADEVLRRVDQAQNWKGDRRHATILMSDLRGFTHLSERFTPEEIVNTLNEYFSVMIEVVMSCGGTVDKFMGDAILAVFGVPKALPESERAAVKCALEMHDCLRKLNQKRSRDKLFTLEMGIGIAAGDVVAGNIGSDKRMEYTVIGDAVNIASRLQSIATSGKILTTSNVLEKVSQIVEYHKLPPVTIKGKRHPIDVAEILSLKGGASLSDEQVIDLPLFQKRKTQQ